MRILSLSLAIILAGCGAVVPMVTSRATVGCEREARAWGQFVEVCLEACEHCEGGDRPGGFCPFDLDDVVACYAACPLTCEEHCASEAEVTCPLDCEGACGLEVITDDPA